MSQVERSHRRVMLALCALALSVFVVAWGLEYKVEQYPLKGLAFRVMSPAKLLTEKERPPRSAAPQTGAVVPATLKPALLFGAVIVAAALQCRRGFCGVVECLRRPGESIRAKRDAAWTYFGFRPPPALSIA